jgi:hypothetical protein
VPGEGLRRAADQPLGRTVQISRPAEAGNRNGGGYPQHCLEQGYLPDCFNSMVRIVEKALGLALKPACNTTNFTNVKVTKDRTYTFGDALYYGWHQKNICCVGPYNSQRT